MEGTSVGRRVKITVILAVVAIIALAIPLGVFSRETVPGIMTAADEGPEDQNCGINNDGSGRSGDTDIIRERLNESVILYVGSPVAYVKGVETRIDPGNIEVTPVISDNVEMVPVRFIAESLGGSVRWDQDSLSATVILDGRSYKFTQGSSIMLAGGSSYPLGAEVWAYKGRTFVPLDKFVKALGKKVFYDRGLIIISDDEVALDTEKDKELISEWIAKLSYLPAVGSRDKLLSLLEEGQKRGTGDYIEIILPQVDTGISVEKEIAAWEAEGSSTPGIANQAAKVAESPAADMAVADPSGREQDYSTTNVQVQGVDEGDIVKTDGNYIYQVSKRRVVIAKVDNPDNMEIAGILDYTDKNLTPQELYLHDEKLVVIGSSKAYFPIYKTKDGVRTEIYPSPRYSQNSVKLLIYDISDKRNARLVREVELGGSYVSSRKIGAAVYLVANDYINYYRIQDNVPDDEPNITPYYRDTAEKDEYISIGYDSIRYFPGAIYDNYMIVAGINVDGNKPANISTYLGAGQNIYASPENLYVAVTSYSRVSSKAAYEEKTQVYKFGMKDAKLTYLCKGEVPGIILNQFSMDEYGGSFRMATTKGSIWAADERTSKNCLYVMDSMLSITGSIEDMAPGERIYSVRFMGDRAYVVTFKTVDPLFVIDLKDPKKPAVLGALKIPGYSDYLHPYDENHIIGFGKDTVEIKGQAYYQGMKVALFDVTDVSNPVQKFTEIIGDRGTDSELLSNHKALLFSKEKNLLAFPVTLMEIKDAGKAGTNALEYGEFTFQGALVYNLDLENGFKLKGRITHLSADDYLKAGRHWYGSDKNVSRIIYIGDNLFTLSNSMIKANAMEDLKEKGSVVIP
jgi:inhibitor of cysteine peptidase